MQLAPLYPIIHRILTPAFPNCLWAGHCSSPTIALTFDDGPHPSYTLPLLEVLDEFGVLASFFWLGACVQRSPAVARAVYERGHWIGLHGYDHRSFPALSAPDLRRTLERTQSEISIACQLPPDRVRDQVRDVRPPNGLFTPQTLTYLTAWNYRPVMWSVVPEDWVRPGVSTVVERVQRQVKNGSLIVLHDGVCGGADVVETTRRLIPLLLSQGYRFVTIDQLWQMHPLLAAS